MLPEVKSFIVLALIGWFALLFGRLGLSSPTFPPGGFKIYERVAAGVLASAFLAGFFWLYVALAGFWVWRHIKAVNPAAMLAATLFLTPFLSVAINGIGPLDHLLLFKFQYLVVWLGAWVVYKKTLEIPAKERIKFNAVDFFALAWVAFQVVLSLSSTNLTNAVRVAAYELTEVWLIIYVFSRAIRTVRDLRLVLYVFILMCFFYGAVACFEVVRSWLLYSNLANTLGVPRALGGYLAREGTGLLRAQGSTGHPIVLGVMMGMGFCFSLALDLKDKKMLKYRALIALTLLAGLGASISRGPWAATVFAVVVWAFLPPFSAARSGKVLGVLAGAAVLVLSLPGGEKIIDLLPWVGTVESFNVDYRARLLDVSWLVFLENPWLGSVTYLDEPIMQTMIQGEGIVDIVNTYVAVALGSGAVGLTLYAGIYLSAMGVLWRQLRRKPSPELRALMAALVCVMVSIGTVSSVSFMPLLCWLLVGMASASGHLVDDDVVGTPKGKG